MNQDIKKLHRMLMAQHQALYEKLDTVTDPTLAQTILTEMQELLHRVDILQGLWFRQTTASLAKSIKKVDAADLDLTAALRKAQSAADYVKGVSRFLMAVDKAIDLAKTLAPMVV